MMESLKEIFFQTFKNNDQDNEDDDEDDEDF